MQHYPPVPCTASQPQTSAALAAAQPAGIVWPSGVSQRPALGRAVGCFATSERSGNSDSGSGDGTVGGGDGGDGDRHGAVAGHREAQTSFRFAVPCAGAHGGALSLAATLLEPAPGAPARGTAAGGGGGGAAGSVAAGTAADPDAAPVAILCHGFASSKEAPLLDAIARRLSEEGVASLRFDFRGNGDSEGVFKYANYLLEVDDLRAAVQFVRSDLKRHVVAIAGHSKGGNAVMLYASRFDDVSVVVNIAGRFDMARGVAERFGEAALQQLHQHGAVAQMARRSDGKAIQYTLTQKDMDERLAIDMGAAAAAVVASRVTTVHGSADATIPVEDAHAFARVTPQHSLHVVEGADHVFREQHHTNACVDATVSAILAASVQRAARACVDATFSAILAALAQRAARACVDATVTAILAALAQRAARACVDATVTAILAA